MIERRRDGLRRKEWQEKKKVFAGGKLIDG